MKRCACRTRRAGRASGRGSDLAGGDAWLHRRASLNRGIRLSDLFLPHRHFLGVLALQGPHAAVHADELEDEAPAELFRVAFDVPAGWAG